MEEVLMTPAQAVSEKKPKRVYKSRKRTWVCLLGKKRKALGLTMRDVAEACNLTSAAVCEIEHGTDPLLSTATRLAEFFGVPIEALWSRPVEQVEEPR